MDKDNKEIHSEMDVVNLSAYTTPVVEVVANNDWVSYGTDNDHFNTLVGYYKGSTTSSSIINGISSQIYGNGLEARDASLKPEQWAQFNNLLSKKDLKKIIFDRKLLGMAAIKVSYKNGRISKLRHWHMDTLRVEKADDNGDINNYYWSNNWKDVKKGDEVESFPAFGKSGKKKDEIYIIKPYVTGQFYYTQPDYAACLPYCELESQIGDYLINDVRNGFSGSLMINFNNGIPSKEVQRRTNQKVIRKFTGATGDKLLFNYNKSAETATTIERLQLDNAPDHYQYLADECVSKIIVGHRITSPLLVGVRENGNGFGSNADEIQVASLLLDKVLINSFREEIIDALDEILTVNNISLDLFFKTSIPRDFFEEAGLVEIDEEETNENTGEGEVEELKRLKLQMEEFLNNNLKNK